MTVFSMSCDVRDQPHGAHIDLLRPLLDEASAGVGIAVGQLLLHLRQAQTVGDQFVGIDANLIFARDAAEGRIVHHVRDRAWMYLLITQSCRDFSSITSYAGLVLFERVPIDRADRTEIGTDAARSRQAEA